MSISRSPSIGRALANAQAQVLVTSTTTLSLPFIRLLRNDEPGGGSPGAFIYLKIKVASLNDEATELPQIRGVHVVRLTPVEPLTAGVREDDHYSWMLEDEQARVKIEHNLEDSVIIFKAWDGPRFGGGKGEVEYVAIVEFEGEVYLKSNVRVMGITW